MRTCPIYPDELTSAPAAEALLEESRRPAVLPFFPENRRRIRMLLYTLLLIGDVGCIFGGFAFGSFVKFGDLQGDTWLNVAMAASPLYVGLAIHNGAYTLQVLEAPIRGARRAAGALIVTFALLFVLSYFLKAEQDVSRLAIGVGVLAAILSIVIVREAAGNWLRTTFGGRFTAVVLIADEQYVDDADGMMVVAAERAGLTPAPHSPFVLQRLSRLLTGADRVVVACSREASANWANLLRGANISGEIIADGIGGLAPIGIGHVGSHTTLVVSCGPLTIQQRAMKRALDLAVAVPLLVLISPLLLLIALAIKLDSRGPVLFRQPRVGCCNQLFKINKFRSMRHENSDLLGNHSTEPDDARTTRVGKFLRHTSLDELPQLFNVIGGSMSLVGPRPHALGSLAGNQSFWDVDERYCRRHTLKPGITGLAQVRGLRGTTHEPQDLSRRLQADLEYIAGWSIWRDLLIMLMTARVLVHNQAY